ncbi:MAG: hypothetical protein R3F43_03615 [bacterium]
MWPRLEQVAEVLVLRRTSKGLPAMLAEVRRGRLRDALRRPGSSGRPRRAALSWWSSTSSRRR